MSDLADLTHHVATYLKPADIVPIEQAYRFGEAAHHGQFRQSGEPYISHPLAVASILAEWHLDAQALTAALLHDVMEDTEITKAQLAEEFGDSVANLVDGLSKLDRIEFESTEQAQAENFRKMLLAMASDLRVILIKLADRLHNMRTLSAVPPEKRKRVATETLEIYAPIANRLGLNSIFTELEDLSFRYLHPTRFRVLSNAIRAARGNRRELVERICESIRQRLEEAHIEATVTGREKHLYSIYRKMQDKNLSFAEVLDIYGFRVLVKDVPSCYLALGTLHALYKPIFGRFKDYVAIPKVNGYQSLHTKLFGPYGTPIEVQIRTYDMHKIAEAGVASHWLYKTTDEAITDMQQKTHQWLQSLLEIQSESGDSIEFLEHIKVNLFPDEVYVFTPKGKILSLPRGATAVDFAYAVHTDVGNHSIAAIINHEPMPLRTELHSGDTVEIITSPNARPNPAWLNYVVTGKARSHVRHYLKTMRQDEAVALGEHLLNQALHALGHDAAQVDTAQWERLIKDTGAASRQEVVADIGLGKRLSIVVARRLMAAGEAIASEAGHTPGTVTIRGSEGIAIQLARCCRPIPGDPIIGMIKKGQGLVVHTHDCPVVGKVRADPGKWLDVSWDAETNKMFKVATRLVVKNQRGVLAKVAAVIADCGSNIDNISMDQDHGVYSGIHFTLQVKNRLHLARVMRELRKIEEVVKILRVKGAQEERATGH